MESSTVIPEAVRHGGGTGGRPPIPRLTGLFPAPVDLQEFLDTLPLGLVVVDAERNILAMNEAVEALTGFDQDEVRGVPCRHALRGSFCQHKCPVLEMGPDSGPVCLSGDVISRDRRRIPVRFTVAPFRDASGRVVGYMEALEDIRALKDVESGKPQSFGLGRIIGHSPQMERVFRVLAGISQTDSSVLLTGETGTGKDLLAEAVHQVSPRSKGPFVKVNCGALPETLLESELFGHVRGAFTGAVEHKPGRIKLAHNGTLFLTEVGDLPLSLQVKLLSFLDDKVIYPLGSTKGVNVDVRVIAATHRDLAEMVRQGRFREDLLFRLNVVRVHVPPLRERERDVRVLLDFFLSKFVQAFAKPVKGFSDDALRFLQAYPFPGNVRELRNIVEFAVNVCRDERVELEHLPAYLAEAVPVSERVDLAPPAGSVPMVVPAKGATWAETERQMILDALLRAKGRRNKAADILGWGRSTLWRKMKEHSIE